MRTVFNIPIFSFKDCNPGETDASKKCIVYYVDEKIKDVSAEELAKSGACEIKSTLCEWMKVENKYGFYKFNGRWGYRPVENVVYWGDADYANARNCKPPAPDSCWNCERELTPWEIAEGVEYCCKCGADL